MDLFEATTLEDIDVLDSPDREEFIEQYIKRARPAIIRGVADDWAEVRNWDLDYLEQKAGMVRVQKQERKGIYDFLSFVRIPFSEFRQTLTTTREFYLSADKILGNGGNIPDDCEHKKLAADVTIPPYIELEDVDNANLWIGPGENRTLLHYDEWDGFLTVVKGSKKFIIYPAANTRYLYPHPVLDLKSMIRYKVVDSKINPVNIQPEYIESVKKATGVQGTLNEKEILFIPGGYWHYVESSGLNIAVNVFSKVRDPKRWQQSPLKEFKLKRRYLLPMIRSMRKVKHLLRL